MISLHITIDDAKAQSALDRYPDRLIDAVEAALHRGAIEIARSGRRYAPKAFSTMTNSINADRVGELHYVVAPHVNYAAFVEGGRRPGKQPGTANGLMEWVRLKFGVQGKELDRTTYLVARAIARNGIKPQPYMRPAADDHRDRIIANVRASAARAAAEVSHG